jgi:hypothetical protein
MINSEDLNRLIFALQYDNEDAFHGSIKDAMADVISELLERRQNDKQEFDLSEKGAVGALMLAGRSAEGLTMKQASDLSGVSIRAMEEWSTEKSQPSLGNLIAVLNTLGFDLVATRPH